MLHGSLCLMIASPPSEVTVLGTFGKYFAVRSREGSNPPRLQRSMVGIGTFRERSRTWISDRLEGLPNATELVSTCTR